MLYSLIHVRLWFEESFDMTTKSFYSPQNTTTVYSTLFHSLFASDTVAKYQQLHQVSMAIRSCELSGYKNTLFYNEIHTMMNGLYQQVSSG